MHELSKACAHLTLVGGEFHQAWEYAGVGLPHRLPGRPLLVPVLGRTQMGKTVHTQTGTQSRAAQVGRKGAL